MGLPVEDDRNRRDDVAENQVGIVIDQLGVDVAAGAQTRVGHGQLGSADDVLGEQRRWDIDIDRVPRRGSQRREVKLKDYFISYGKQDREPGEFVESVTIPLLPANEQLACYKITKRRDEDISALCGAFRIFVNETGWYLLTARLFSLPRARAAYVGRKAWIDRAFGTLIAAFGLKIALT